MKKLENYILAAVILATGITYTSCTKQDDISVTESKITSVAFVDLSKSSFDVSLPTRAVSDNWTEGDVINLFYKTGIYVVCQYNSGEWKLVANGGTLPSSGSFQARYFEGSEYSSTASTYLELNEQNADYVDSEVQFSYSSEVLSIYNSVLSPSCSRLRFSGEAGTKINVSGFNTPVQYAFSSNELQSSTSAVSLTVGDDGYTPYIYGLAQSDGTLTLVKDGIKFTRQLTPSDLPSGRGGCAAIPTMLSPGKWKCSVSVTTGSATVQSTSVTLNGSVSGLENEESVGFIISTSSSFSSFADMSVAKSSDGSFSHTFDDLESGTTYYYVAYVVIGDDMAIGSIKSFTISQSSDLNVKLGTYTSLSDAFAFCVEGGSKVKYIKYASWKKGYQPSTEEDIINQLLQKSSSSVDYCFATIDLTSSTDYILYVIGLDENGNNGDLLSFNYSTLSAANQPEATISNIQQQSPTSTYKSIWTYDVTLNGLANGFYMYSELDPESFTEPYFVALLIQMTIEQGTSYYFEGSKSITLTNKSYSSNSVTVYARATNSSGQLSGIVNYKSSAGSSSISYAENKNVSEDGIVYVSRKLSPENVSVEFHSL